MATLRLASIKWKFMIYCQKSLIYIVNFWEITDFEAAGLKQSLGIITHLIKFNPKLEVKVQPAGDYGDNPKQGGYNISERNKPLYNGYTNAKLNKWTKG